MQIDWTAFRQRVKELELQRRMELVRQIQQEAPDADDSASEWDRKLLAAWDRLQVASGSWQAGDLEKLKDEVMQLEREANNDRRRANGAVAIAGTFDALAACYRRAKQIDLSRKAFEEAAEWHDRAGDPVSAAQARKAAVAMESDLSGNIDLLLTEELQEGNSWSALSERIATALTAGDHFQAKQLAAELTSRLKNLELVDPREVGVDAAVESWTTHVAPQTSVTEYYRALASVLQAYLQISRTDPLFPSYDSAAILREANAQTSEVLAGLSGPAATDAVTKANALLEARKDKFSLEHDSIWGENESRDYGVSRQDLLARVIQLEDDAPALGYRYYDAQARLLHGQILNYDRQLTAALSLIEDSRVHLMALCPAGDPYRFTNTERDLYQTVLYYKLVVLSQLEDSSAISVVCDEAIQNIETQRYVINSPELQNAFLNWRTAFYVMGIAAARRLGQWDKMLERMELIKARTAIRSSPLASNHGADGSETEKEFQMLTDRVQAGSADESLKTRRRELWELLSMARMRERISETPPGVTVAALQHAMEPDEIALSYFRMAPNVYLVVVISADSFCVERIELPAEAQSDLNDLTGFLQTLTSFTSELDEALARFGPLLMPETIRGQMRGRTRLILSPHRSLHLFPFHACPWEHGFLGQQFAVRYTPNLTSLLLPLEPARGNGLFSLGIREFKIPPFDQNPLLRAEEEAEHVADFYTGAGFPAQILQGPSASREAFQALRDSNTLETFRWFHLSTHGTSVFEGDNLNHPLEASLTLENGRLDGLEITSLRLNAELVVLSACNSGQRAISGRGLEEVPGDDVFGLQSALFAAGARCVLGSLWIVNDDAAFEMICRFHKFHASGAAPDVALQKALNEYLTECPRREAFYWSGWFLSTLGSGAGTSRQEVTHG